MPANHPYALISNEFRTMQKSNNGSRITKKKTKLNIGCPLTPTVVHLNNESGARYFHTLSSILHAFTPFSLGNGDSRRLQGIGHASAACNCPIRHRYLPFSDLTAFRIHEYRTNKHTHEGTITVDVSCKVSQRRGSSLGTMCLVGGDGLECSTGP